MASTLVENHVLPFPKLEKPPGRDHPIQDGAASKPDFKVVYPPTSAPETVREVGEMETITSGLASGAITVLLCTSSAGVWLQKQVGRATRRLDPLFACCFCTSWWVSLAMLNEFTFVQWAATVAVANFTILGIHASMSTTQEDEPELSGPELDEMVKKFPAPKNWE